MDNLADRRKSYGKDELRRKDLKEDPIQQFALWYRDAEKNGITEPNAMTLATVSEDGQPSARIVLLKGFAQEGFTFYTNYESEKGRQLVANPKAALVFWWDKLERQVRIEGRVEKVSRDESQRYFQSRPRGSQVSAWASPQSRVLSREALNKNRADVKDRFADQDPLPLPEHWGGFILRPHRIEFWQGRKNRYHDRFLYQSLNDQGWTISRLAP